MFFRALAAAAFTLALPALAQQTLTLGLLPAEDPRLIVTEAQPLIDRMEQALKMEVKPFVATDYNGVIEAMRARKLDIAFYGPFSYVLAAQVADAEAFVIAPIGKAGASYKSVIIARKDHNIRTLADLKGKNFAFVDPSSTSGHLFPKAGLLKAGYDPDTFFGRVIFSGGHDASAIAVQNGKVDAAAIADALLDVAIARGAVNKDEVVVIWTSDPIPGPPFAMRKDLPPADVASPMKCEAAVKQAVEAFGLLDGIVAAAGIYRDEPAAEMFADAWRLTLSVNLDGVFYTIRAALPYLKENSSIVTLTSMAAHMGGSFGHAHYGASKGGVLALTRSLARELGPKTRINAVSPGVIVTPMTSRLLADRGEAVIQQTPLRRHGTSEEVANVIAFLCSDASSFVTGEAIHVNGGFYMGG